MSLDKHIKILKYIMYFLLIISLFFGVLDKVKADTITYEYNPNGTYSQAVGESNWTAESKININMNGITWRRIIPKYASRGILLEYGLPKDSGDLLFTTFWEANLDNPPTIVINSNGKFITCENSQYLAYGDRQYYNHLCRGYVSPSNGYNSIVVAFMYSVGHEQIQQFAIGNYMTIIKDNNSSIATAINNQSNQQHTDANNINNSIKDTNNTLKDSTIDSPNSNTSNWGNMNASNGVITNLLTLPIQLMQGYVNGLNSSCTPFNLGDLFGNNITLPCINIGNLIGSALWGVIDVLFSGFMIFGIAKKLIKIFNDFTNMRGNQVDELYGGGA